MRNVTAVALLVAVSLTSFGCKPKPPKTRPDLPPTREEMPRETEPMPPPVDATPQALPRDLVELNALLEQQGLLGDLYYDYDSALLGEAARERLSRNAAFLTQHPEYQVTIEGHCDERGTNEYNLALGERRAAAANGYLVNLAVDGARLRGISLGEERPQCTVSAEGCWQKNRRAHFVVTARTGD
ncbi:MAG: OmpA family protein [Acidobacteriota bacterium]